jgi:sigma-E factor negative regulatory protein RseB
VSQGWNAAALARRGAVAALCALTLGTHASGATPAAGDPPRDWLARMNEALTTRNYDGTFMHVRDGRVETLRIIHRVQDGAVTERLVSLDGSGREFIRRGGELMCYLPDQRTVLVERRPSERTLLGSLPQIDDSTAQYYDIRSLERGRLMGRDAQVVAVTPRDEYRYGYRLWIDERTAMPLKTQLCDGKGRVIEQIVFASLVLPERIADAEFQPAMSTDGFRWLRDDARTPALADASPDAALWSAMRLPPGFRMTTRGSQAMPGSGSPASHLVFSDGVASVSVFVETRPPAAGALDGEARMGSSSAFSTTVDGHQVTAVGEVPPETVRFIATQVRPDAPRERGAGGVPAFAPREAPRR